MPTPHPRFDTFFASLKSAPFAAWQGTVYRQSPPRWQSRPYRLTGGGAYHSAGRWHIQGLMPAVYASTDPDTIHEETMWKARNNGFPPGAVKAQLIVEMVWSFSAALDLTSPTGLAFIGISTTHLIRCDWEEDASAGREALTQAIARAAFETGCEALIVPSARRVGGVNVVYFPSNRREGSRFEAVDESAVPFVHGL